MNKDELKEWAAFMLQFGLLLLNIVLWLTSAFFLVISILRLIDGTGEWLVLLSSFVALYVTSLLFLALRFWMDI